jgi:hypothetical protein
LVDLFQIIQLTNNALGVGYEVLPYSLKVISNGMIVAGTGFTGNGSGLTNLNADNLLTGTVPAARVNYNSTNITTGPLQSASTNFAMPNIFIATNGNVGIGTNVPRTTLDVVTGRIYAPDGASGSPGFAFGNKTDVGFYRSGNNIFVGGAGSGARFSLDNDWGGFRLGATYPIAWSNATNNAAGTLDAGLSRLGAGSIGFGNGALGSISGSVTASNLFLSGSLTATNTLTASNVVATAGMTLVTNAVMPTVTAGKGIFWNSNDVLYWLTATKTNLISDGR